LTVKGNSLPVWRPTWRAAAGERQSRLGAASSAAGRSALERDLNKAVEEAQQFKEAFDHVRGVEVNRGQVITQESGYGISM